MVQSEQTAMTWVRVGCNYAISFVVAPTGYLAPLRRTEAQPGDLPAAS